MARRSRSRSRWTGGLSADQGGEVKPLPVKDVVEIASGSVQMCVRDRNGTAGCWGLRSLLGDGADDHQDSPIAVPGATL